MIPAHGWGGTLWAAGSRLVTGGGCWAVIGPESSLPAEAKHSAFLGKIEALADPQPTADAWRGTARELLALLVPAIGKHCKKCDDVGTAQCACCRGSGEVECHNPGCHHLHECSACDGDGHKTCPCCPRDPDSLVIHGARFVAAQAQTIRGLLHAAGDAACVMWVVSIPRASASAADDRVLFVDVARHRFALTPTGAAEPYAGKGWNDKVTL